MAQDRFSTYSGAPSIQPSLGPTEASFPQSASASARSSLAPAHQPSRSKSYMRSSPKSHFFNRNGNENPNPSTSTFGDPDLTSWSGSLDRMQDARLERQRYIMSGMKSEEVDMLALGAKVERALARRMSTQDADMKEGMKAEEETEGVKVDVDEPSLNKSLNEKRAEIAAI